MSEAHKDHRLVLVVAGSHQLPGPGPGTLTVQAVMHSTPVQITLHGTCLSSGLETLRMDQDKRTKLI